MSETVDASLDATLEALGHLRDGLANGGFVEALPTYRRMVEVIVAQRVTKLQTDDHGFDTRFARVVTLATEISQTLEPWVRLMEQLATMDGIATGVRQALAEEATTATEQTTGSVADAVLVWLTAHRGPQSLARIRAGVNRPAPDIAGALTQLVADNTVIERHVSHRHLWEARQA